jgi:PE family
MTTAATDIAGIGSNVSAAHMAAAAKTLAVMPAAADEVSAGIAQLFSQFGQDYQALAARAAAFEEQFVQALNTSAGVYADIEAFLATYLQYTIGTEDSAVSLVVANPTLLFTPLPYEFALGPVVLPFLIPLFFIGLLIYVYALETGQASLP